MPYLETLHPTSKPIPLIVLFHTIVGTNNMNNTDDVGLVVSKVGVDSPRRVR
jgi:hypothetical protein